MDVAPVPMCTKRRPRKGKTTAQASGHIHLEKSPLQVSQNSEKGLICMNLKIQKRVNCPVILICTS